MNFIKLYKYDKSKESDGYRGEDLTKYVLQGASNHEDITQELDTSTITLLGYPTGKAFTPESKFIVDICENENIVETLHRIVEEDAVQIPVLSDENYFTHFITFTEPSVVAQKRVVDNIAVTYKLKDVSLDTRTTYDLTEKNGFVNDTYPINPQYNYGVIGEGGGSFAYYGKRFQFSDVVKVKIGDNAPTDLRYIAVDETTSATIILPKLLVYGGVAGGKNLTNGIPVSIYYRIVKQDLGGNNILPPIENTIIETSDLSSIFGSKKGRNRTKSEFFIESVNTGHINLINVRNYYRKYTDGTATDKTDSDYQIPIQIEPDVKYYIEIQRANLYVDSTELSNAAGDYFYTGEATMHTMAVTLVPDGYATTMGTRTATILNQKNNSSFEQNATIVTYTTNAPQAILAHGIAYSALNLIRKAILNTSTFEKISSVPVGDINSVDQTTGAYNYNCPFYIDSEFINELAATEVVESFFQNKNLWEVFIEAGNYIHAIPELKFGANEKFMLTFNRLGQTQEGADGGTRASLLNSQSVDDYIAATNSYVSNLVQLGGSIDEWIVAKTTTDDALVYNDTAEIITSLPILELLDLEIKCNSSDYVGIGISNGSIGNATKYIYEKNVYALLSIRFEQVPNKGIAMYYELGDNKLQGGDYKLPTAPTDMYNDYTIKKLIYVAITGQYPTDKKGTTSGYWTNIKVSDFSFHIKYRTKGDVRQTHVRPDLRKFLLNTSWDKAPQHYQINNQTDILVDSQKFGQNMYGKLLRTGNNEYKENEWLASPFDLRHKGEIRRINGEIYYVAKVDSIYYSDHIESTVVYSKDYNELSNVIGIPSEPRFYEISEQSQIKRDVAINDYFLLTLDAKKIADTGYIENAKYVQALILGKITETDNTQFPRFALTAFKGDNTNGVIAGVFGDQSLYIEILSPINAYSSGNTMTLSWSMLDNFSAGDKLGDAVAPSGSSVDNVYMPMTAVQYTDKYGKASLFDFFILSNYDINNEENSFVKVRNLPESPVTAKSGVTGKTYVGDLTGATNTETGIFSTNVNKLDENYNSRGLTLLKDCRETIAFNYNLVAITDSDTFITSPFLFAPDKTKATVVCLREEVNKFSNGYINSAILVNFSEVSGGVTTNIIPHTLTSADMLIYDSQNIYGKTAPYGFGIAMRNILSKVKSYMGNTIKAVAICYNFDINRAQNPFVIARNIPQDIAPDEAIKNWIFAPPRKTYFNRTE